MTHLEFKKFIADSRYCILKNFRGLSDQQAMIIPGFREKPINWLLGHLVYNRDQMLSYFGAEELLSPEMQANYASYRKGSEKLSIRELLSLISSSGKQLEQVFAGLSPLLLSRKIGKREYPIKMESPSLEDWIRNCLLYENSYRRKLILAKRRITKQ